MRNVFDSLFATLRRKIAFAVFLVMLVAGSAFVYLAHRTGYTMLEQQTQLKAKSIAGILTNLIERTMIEGGKEHVQQTLSSATASHDVLNAYLLKTTGNVTFRANANDTITSLPLEQFQKIESEEGEKYLSVQEGNRLVEYVIIPVMNKPACYTCHKESSPIRGYFAVKFGIDDMRAIAAQHRTTNLLMTLITFGSLGFIIYFTVSLLIVRPVGKLHFHIKKVEEGIKYLESGERTTFPLLPEPTSNDEIAELSRDVNKLVRRLNDGNAKLIEMHQLQLEQAARLGTVGEMAASMAHEIKNPIAGVLGAVQIFESELQPDDPKKEIFSEMKVQLDRVIHAVTDLLSFARPTPPLFEEIPIHEIIKRTRSMLSKQINDNHVEVRMDLAADANIVEADKKQLQQVVWNILLNAIQSMEHKGVLTIGTRKNERGLHLIVSDTGKGISKEHLVEIFKPFFTTKNKGTGLGMTVTKRIIEQHKGEINVASELGKGTTVSIILPRKQGGA